MEWLLALLPDGFVLLIIAGLSLAAVLGLVSSRRALALLMGLVLLWAFEPFGEALLEMLPWWASVLLLMGFGLATLQALASLFIGREAAAEMTGSLAADLVRLVLRMFLLPLRLICWLARRG